MKSIFELISIEEAGKILYENEYQHKSVSWDNHPTKYREPYFRAAKALMADIQARIEDEQ